MTDRMRCFLRLIFWVNFAIALSMIAFSMLTHWPGPRIVLLGNLWVGYRVDSWLHQPS